MVRMRRSGLALCVAAIGVAACDAAGPVPPFDDTPMVAVLITPGPPPRLYGFPPDSGLFAALLTTGTPIRSPYLRADRFEMRRVSDGALFAWRPVAPRSEAIAVFSFVDGNYFLPRRDGASGLGSESLTPGEVYELVVDAGVRRIVGRTRMPGGVEFVSEPTDGDTILRWRSAPGAAGYGVFGRDIYTTRRIADTAVVMYRDPPFLGQTPNIASVFAYDSNFVAFSGDPRVSQAGISGGWGVFGSYTRADKELPRREGPPPPP